MKIKNFIYSGNLSLKIEDTPFMTLKGRKEKKNEGRNKEDRKEGKADTFLLVTAWKKFKWRFSNLVAH